MKRAFVAASLFTAAFAVGFFVADSSQADATLKTETSVVEVVEVDAQGATDLRSICDGAVEVAKKCSTSSDCPNSKCKSGKCGGCSTSSDCKFGKCKSGQCGGCSTSSDCGSWGKCNSGQCGGCSTSSDCGGFGSCRSGHCEKTPY